MSDDMNLIMENWRNFSNRDSFVLNEQAGAPTVGAVIEAINLYSMAQQSPWQKSIQIVIKIVGDAAEFADAINLAPDAVTDLIEGLINLADTAESDGILSTGSLKALFSLAPSLRILKNTKIAAALAERAQAMGINIDITQILAPVLNLVGVSTTGIPLGSLVAGAKFIWSAAKGAKEVGNIIKTSKDPEAAFEKTIEAIMNAPDNKDTTSGYLTLFNIDDKWQEMLDDKIDAAFIQHAMTQLKAVGQSNSNMPITNINFNNLLIGWLKQNHAGRHLGGSPLVQPAAAE
jgi:hypothetical protein